MDWSKTFSNWPQETHETPDQIKRLTSAKSAKTTPASVDKEQMTGEFPGSGASPYHTTLTSCTCVDFVRRKLPCKHVYRLAIELGMLDETAETGINKNSRFSPNQLSWEEAVAELEILSIRAQDTIKDFLYRSLYCTETVFPILLEECDDDLPTSALLEEIDAPIEALCAFKRNQLIKVLDEHSISGFKRNMSLKNLAAWCVEHIPDLWSVVPRPYVFRFVDGFQKAQRKTYSYLLRKFDWDVYFDDEMNPVSYPHGATAENAEITTSLDGHSERQGSPYVYYFPDDKITRLLTKYGCNRCLNGFIPSIQDRSEPQ